MKTNYEKILKLGLTQNITEDAVRQCLHCNLVKARSIYQQLVRTRAVVDGKVANQAEFKKIALYRTVYDEYWEIDVKIDELIRDILIDDENFIRLIRDNVIPTISFDMPSEERESHLFLRASASEQTGYAIKKYAVRALAEMLQAGENLFLDGDTAPAPTAADNDNVIILEKPKKR